MRKNIGYIDRVARFILGTLVIGAGILFQSWWGVVGLIPLATAFMRWCPAYSIFRLNTCERKTCGNVPGTANP